jgi:hypothetical protein
MKPILSAVIVLSLVSIYAAPNGNVWPASRGDRKTGG